MDTIANFIGTTASVSPEPRSGVDLILWGVGILLVGAVAGGLMVRLLAGGTIRTARREADSIRSSARSEAESQLQKAQLDAERDTRERRRVRGRRWLRASLTTTNRGAVSTTVKDYTSKRDTNHEHLRRNPRHHSDD